MARMSKLEMARVIVQALYNLDELPPPDNVNVRRRASPKLKVVESQYEMAIAALDSVEKRKDLEMEMAKTNRGHVDCIGCPWEKVELPKCTGHGAGPSACQQRPDRDRFAKPTPRHPTNSPTPDYKIGQTVRGWSGSSRWAKVTIKSVGEDYTIKVDRNQLVIEYPDGGLYTVDVGMLKP